MSHSECCGIVFSSLPDDEMPPSTEPGRQEEGAEDDLEQDLGCVARTMRRNLGSAGGIAAGHRTFFVSRGGFGG